LKSAATWDPCMNGKSREKGRVEVGKRAAIQRERESRSGEEGSNMGPTEW
jgi:hypothetical protein